MGLGHALSEEFVVERRRAGHRDAEVAAPDPADRACRGRGILVEEPQPEGPYGAKGVGEAGLVPTAAAVAGALAAFDGIRRTRLPMKDSPAARAVPRLVRAGRPRPAAAPP